MQQVRNGGRYRAPDDGKARLEGDVVDEVDEEEDQQKALQEAVQNLGGGQREAVREKGRISRCPPD